MFDVHYNELEYLKLNANIVSSIVDNFAFVRVIVEIDSLLKQYSSDSHYGVSGININEVINEVLGSVSLKPGFLDRILKYYKERYPYDFYYTNKDEITNLIGKVK